MADDESPRRRRGTRSQAARRWVLVVWALLRLGDGPLLWLCFRAADPLTGPRITVVLEVLWTTALLAGVWQRQAWARYACLAACAYGVWVFVSTLAPLIAPPGRGQHFVFADFHIILIVDIVCYAAATLILALSKSIAHLTDPEKR